MSMSPSVEDCLQPSRCIDSSHPAILTYAASVTDSRNSAQENAVALYYRVRDGIRYNPYAVADSVDSFLASTTLKAGEGWCVPKAILLAALCRGVGIPARVGFADVRNHLSTERLRATMQTDIFYFHGYTSIYLNDRWVKATPAFNVELCNKFQLRPLEFDGEEDSLYHPYDEAGNKHMEYVNDRGEYLDAPLEELLACFREHYPNFFPDETTQSSALPDRADWEADIAREAGLS